MTDAPVFSKGRDLVATAKVLAPWLAEHLGVRSVVVQNLDYPRGAGTSNETILFEAHTSDTIEHLVLRVAPRPEYQMFLDPALHMQFTLLRTLRQGGWVRVPEVLWFEEDPAVLGQQFFVMRRMHGRVPVSMPVYNSTGWLVEATAAERRTLWRNAMEQFASIHAVPLTAVGFLDESAPDRPGVEQQLSYWTRFAAWALEGAIPKRLETLLAWLADNVPGEAASGLSWGDARIGNMMFDEKFDVVGVMDWEQASLAGAMADLAWWLMFDDLHSVDAGLDRLDGLGTRQETIDLWQDLTGRVVDDLHWHEVFAAVKTGLLALRSRSLLNVPDARRGGGGSLYLTKACRLLDLPPWEEAQP